MEIDKEYTYEEIRDQVKKLGQLFNLIRIKHRWEAIDEESN
jgi:hypothetical protein